MLDFIDKMFGWECKWTVEKRITEGEYSQKIYEIYYDKNKNGLRRYKKVLVNQAGVCNSNMYLMPENEL